MVDAVLDTPLAATVPATETSGRAPSAVVVVMRARVVHQFIGEESNELDLLPGEVFPVFSAPPASEGNGWWIGKTFGRTGFFPSSFVQEVKE
jgi:hypothetical protein